MFLNKTIIPDVIMGVFPTELLFHTNFSKGDLCDLNALIANYI